MEDLWQGAELNSASRSAYVRVSRIRQAWIWFPVLSTCMTLSKSINLRPRFLILKMGLIEGMLFSYDMQDIRRITGCKNRHKPWLTRFIMCYGLNCVPPKFECWSPNLQCDCIWRQGLYQLQHLGQISYPSFLLQIKWLNFFQKCYLQGRNYAV